MTVNAIAPISINTVCTRSVHTTAVSPPDIVNNAAMASNASILGYVSHFIACSINIAPAYRSDYKINNNK